MAKIGKIEFEVVWKWWAAPLCAFLQSPGVSDCPWLLKAADKWLLPHSFKLKGPL